MYVPFDVKMSKFNDCEKFIWNDRLVIRVCVKLRPGQPLACIISGIKGDNIKSKIVATKFKVELVYLTI